ncbi:MAG: ATP-dependent DNA ligase [Leptospirales bacterium]
MSTAIDTVCHCFSLLESLSSRLEMASALGELLKELSVHELAPVVYMVQGQLSPSFRGGEMGMSSKLVLRAVERAVSDASISLESSPAHLLGVLGDPGFLVEQVLKGRKGSSLSLSEVFEQLCALSDQFGEGSQEGKVRALAGLFLNLSPLCARFVARFVVGKLRLGVGDATIVDAMAQWQGGKSAKPAIERAYNLCSDLGRVATVVGKEGVEGLHSLSPMPGFPIRMALCERLSSGEEIFDKIGICAVESKYDGFRCQVHSNGERVQVFSRNLEETTSMFPEIVEATRNLFGNRSVIFEGEALGYDAKTGGFHPFQVTITRKRKHNVLEKSLEIPLKALVFDLMYLDGESWLEKPFRERRKRIEELFPAHSFALDEPETAPSGVFGTSRLIVAEHPSIIDQFFDEVLEEGFEGIIAKRMDGVYTAGSRNFNWIKLKRSYKKTLSDTLDLVLIGYYAGKGQRTRLGIGAVLAAAYDTELDKFVSIARIGSGLTEENWINLREMLQASEVTERPQSVLSEIEPEHWVEPRYVVTVRVDDITRSSQHMCGRRVGEEGYALRFPRMISQVRADKGPMDATSVSEVKILFDRQRNLLARHRKTDNTEILKKREE